MDAVESGHTEAVQRYRLGRVTAEVREVDGRRVLRIGDWSTVVDDRTEIRHENGRFLLSQRIVVVQPGRPAFVHRYRLPWGKQLGPFWQVTYDYWDAEADDEGLPLVEFLGGTSNWR
ncbi:hypothetical protein HUT16_28185 [Kitasatospora sp. NA04385]|uniref:hypothetical protein n=1 Tax=Kitasatospora sp. NA04385 TaxID=2742135 RepID=UPI001591E48E|nr:hypothetical protein [Kitasatospora sp. NA04385]QKW22440.1 hypothetical protein HUT16_28185 [Kitasatospora sp. NA04385]